MEFNREFFDAGIYRVGTQSTKWDGIRKDCGKVIQLLQQQL